MIVPLWPIVAVDVLGSAAVLLIIIICIRSAWAWSRAKRDDVFRHYVFMLTLAIGAFAIFRSFGHLVKQALLFAGFSETWELIAPFSGAGNTMTFVIIFAFSLYFERLHQVKFQIAQTSIDLAQTTAEKDAAQKSYERLRTIFDGMEDAVYIVGEDYRISFFNRKMKEVAPDVREGSYCYTILRGLAGPCEDCNLHAVLDDDKNITREFSFLTSDRTFNLLEIPMRWIDNSRVKLNVARDISLQKELEEQLLHAQKLEAIGTLAGGFAHDINNSLTPILGYADLAMMKVKDDPVLARHLEEIKRCAKRSSELIKRILAFSRRQILQPKELNINELMKDIEIMLQSLLEENIKLEFHLAQDLSYVSADHSQIEQILTNLAVNARDAMPKGGVLIIETMNVEISPLTCQSCGQTFYGPHVLIMVSDSGSGIEAKTMERIFEPYFTTKGREKGTGLGLAMVHGIVHQHGGHINLYSEENLGTTIKIYLPGLPKKKAPPPEPDMIEAVPERPEPLLENLKILIAEDNDTVRELTATILREFGYEVQTAECGGKALEVASENSYNFDLLLTDVIMPDMNGKQLADKIHNVSHDLPVLFMSGYTDNVIASHGVLGDDIEFIQKPFLPKELADRIRAIVRKARTAP